MADEIEEAVDDLVEEPVVETPAAPQWDEETAAEAKALGWKSPDEWSGDIPAGYIDNPERYLERAESFRPFKNLKARLEQASTGFEDRIRRMEAMQDKALEAQRSQHQRDLLSLDTKARDAMTMADSETYDRVVKQRAELQKTTFEAPRQEQPKRDPDVAKYIETESWAKDPVTRQQGSMIIDAGMKAGMKFATPMDEVRYAEGVMRTVRPDLFQVTAEPKPQQTMARVDGGGLAGGAAKSGSFGALPAEAKRQFAKDAAAGLFKNDEAGKKRYADDYNDS